MSHLSALGRPTLVAGFLATVPLFVGCQAESPAETTGSSASVTPGAESGITRSSADLQEAFDSAAASFQAAYADYLALYASLGEQSSFDEVLRLSEPKLEAMEMAFAVGNRD
jgi:hypothetical protein